LSGTDAHPHNRLTLHRRLARDTPPRPGTGCVGPPSSESARQKPQTDTGTPAIAPSIFSPFSLDSQTSRSGGASSAPPVELVVFDLGGVWVRISHGWDAAAAAAGVGVPGGLSALIDDTATDPITRRFETGVTDRAGFVAEVREATGLAPEAIERVLRAWLIEPYEGLHEMMDELDRTSVRTACLSNTNATHWSILTDREGPLQLPMGRLDFRFASHELGRMKPDPDIYREVERATGVAAARVVFFDDSPPNVHAASALGWRAFRIDPTRQTAPQMRHALRSLGLSVGS